LKADFAPRLAFEKTGSNWFYNNKNWYRANGKAFFLNFWYKKFMVVDEKTIDLIDKGMPSQYASMSDSEFFAELYALYYSENDPRRADLPADIAEWLNANVGAGAGAGMGG
jgi:hypothetical protein